MQPLSRDAFVQLESLVQTGLMGNKTLEDWAIARDSEPHEPDYAADVTVAQMLHSMGLTESVLAEIQEFLDQLPSEGLVVDDGE